MRMAVGHKNGKIALWNIDFLIEPKLLKTVDFFKSPITSLDFVSLQNELFVAAELGGHVSIF